MNRNWKVGDHFRQSCNHFSSVARITKIYKDSQDRKCMNFIFLNEDKERLNFLLSILDYIESTGPRYEYVSEEEAMIYALEL